MRDSRVSGAGSAKSLAAGNGLLQAQGNLKSAIASALDELDPEELSLAERSLTDVQRSTMPSMDEPTEGET